MCAGFAGCRSAESPAAGFHGDTSASPTSMVVRGDWNDVRPAVVVAAPQIEAALLSSGVVDGGYRFEFQTIAAEPAWLIARPEGSADTASGATISIRLTASVGRFGSPERERRLLEAAARRLEDLAGVDYRPLR